MTTIRKIVTSKIDGSNADNNDLDEVRPFGETAFYIDNNGPADKLVLSIHDGTRTHQKSKVLGPGVLYGSNADSGDGGGYDTIKLIPDAALGTDQYIVVDPTGGEPGHIHLRAGGTQDSSSADLYLGGELTNVRVSDTSDDVRIRTTIVGEGYLHRDWRFDINGRLTFPQGGAIESHGMGWTGFTNGESGSPLSIAYKSNSESPVGLSEILLTGSTNTGVVSVYTANTATGYQWTFDENGGFTFPDATVQTTAFKQGVFTFEIDETNTTATISSITGNFLIVRPAGGYAGSDTHTVTLPAGHGGQRLVIHNQSTLCDFVVEQGLLTSTIAPQARAEFIYDDTVDNIWIPLYGVV